MESGKLRYFSKTVVEILGMQVKTKHRNLSHRPQMLSLLAFWLVEANDLLI